MKDVNVLIVDDELFTVIFLEHHLRELGYNCLIATNRKQCLENINSMDVVLLDYFLKDENGMDLLIELKKLNPTTPVIMLSSQELVSTAIKSLKYGAYDYLEKCDLNYGKLNDVIIAALSSKAKAC